MTSSPDPSSETDLLKLAANEAFLKERISAFTEPRPSNRLLHLLVATAVTLVLVTMGLTAATERVTPEKRARNANWGQMVSDGWMHEHGQAYERSYSVSDLVAAGDGHRSPGKLLEILQSVVCSCPQCQQSPIAFDAAARAVLVRLDAQGHQKVEEELARMRAYGNDRIRVRCLWVAGSEEDIRRLHEFSNNPDGVAPAFARNRISDRLAADDDLSVPRAVARMATEKRLPMRVEAVEQHQAEAIQTMIEESNAITVLSRPTVDARNGQVVHLMSAVLRPLVTGIVDRQPRIEQIPDGMMVDLQPVVRDKHTVRLDAEFTLTNLLGIEIAMVASNVHVQVPEIETQQVSAAADLAAGQTLLIGGLARTVDNVRQEMFLMIQAEALPGDE